MLFLKFIIGGLIVLIIDFISRTKYYVISGLIPLFPTFALIAHILILKNGVKPIIQLQNTIIFELYSLIPYAVYLISLYILINKTNTIIAFIISISFWFISAFIIWKIYNTFN